MERAGFESLGDSLRGHRFERVAGQPGPNRNLGAADPRDVCPAKRRDSSPAPAIKLALPPEPLPPEASGDLRIRAAVDVRCAQPRGPSLLLALGEQPRQAFGLEVRLDDAPRRQPVFHGHEEVAHPMPERQAKRSPLVFAEPRGADGIAMAPQSAAAAALLEIVRAPQRAGVSEGLLAVVIEDLEDPRLLKPERRQSDTFV